MPELAEVRIITDQLNNLFKGQILHDVQIIGGKFIKTGIIGLNNIIFPLHNVSFHSHGKFIYWNFDENHVIFNHLGMSGTFGSPSKHSAIRFLFGSGEIDFVDQRHFGNFSFCNEQKLEEKINALGWDPFLNKEQPKWLLDMVRVYNNKSISEVLMNQECYAGLGNWLKNECLYACKIHPGQSVSKLTDEQIFSLGEAFKNIANEALKVGGATIATYSDIYGIAGSFYKQFKVYDRKFDPEGNPIIKIETKDKRSSYFVDKYQKL